MLEKQSLNLPWTALKSGFEEPWAALMSKYLLPSDLPVNASAALYAASSLNIMCAYPMILPVS